MRRIQIDSKQGNSVLPLGDSTQQQTINISIILKEVQFINNIIIKIKKKKKTNTQQESNEPKQWRKVL